MIISGIVMTTRSERLARLSDMVAAIPWAEVHFSDPTGRLVVTIEASDIDESVDRLKDLKSLPGVLAADLAQYRIHEEESSDEPDPT